MSDASSVVNFIDEPVEDIFVSIKDSFHFDWSDVVVEEPKTHSFNKRDSTIEWTTSDVYVKGPKGEKLPIYVELAEQNFWGISGTWPIGTPQEDRFLETLEGFQITYPLTSLYTIETPTPDEEATRSSLDAMWEITVDALKRFCAVKKSKRKVPDPTYSAYMTAKEDGDWKYAVKPIYNFTSSKDQKTGKKFIDESKPQVSYIKFLTKGKGPNIRCDTMIYGPGDKKVSPFKFMSQPNKSIRGDGQVVVNWNGIFWGARGQNSHGASVRLRVSEMNFTPSADNSISKRRMLAPNKTPE